MRKNHFVILLGGVALLVAVAVPVVAHHAFGAEFDRNAPVKLQGKVVKLEWVNPHTWIHLEIENEDGTKEVWAVEGGTPNVLLRRGLEAGLPGTRDGDHRGRLPGQGPLAEARQRAGRDVYGWVEDFSGVVGDGGAV